MRLDFASLTKVSIYSGKNVDILKAKQPATVVSQIQAVMNFLWQSEAFRERWGKQFPRKINEGKIKRVDIPDKEAFVALWITLRLWGAISRQEEMFAKELRKMDKSLFTDHTSVLSHNKAVAKSQFKDKRIKNYVDVVWTNPEMGKKYASVRESNDLAEYRAEIEKLGLQYIEGFTEIRFYLNSPAERKVEMFMQFKYPKENQEDLTEMLRVLTDFDEKVVKTIWNESLFLKISSQYLAASWKKLRKRILREQGVGEYDTFDKFIKLVNEKL